MANGISAAKAAIRERLVALGWPENIGLNDHRKASHGYLDLDGSRVHVYHTHGRGFFVYDPALKLFATGHTREAALDAMVKARGNAQPSKYGDVGRSANGRIL